MFSRYKLSLVLMGVLCIFMGTQIIQGGHSLHGPSFHAYRKWLAPQIPNKLTDTLTFDDLAQIVLQVHGGMMVAAGLGIMFGNRVVAPLVLMYVMGFLMVLQDNPLLVDYIKPAPKSKNYKWGDLTRHLSVIGAAVLIIAASPSKKEELNVEELKEKKAK